LKYEPPDSVDVSNVDPAVLTLHVYESHGDAPVTVKVLSMLHDGCWHEIGAFPPTAPNERSSYRPPHLGKYVRFVFEPPTGPHRAA